MYTRFKIFVDFSFWASDAISIFFSYADLSVFLITLLKYIERWSLSYSNTRFLILLFTSFRLSSLFSNKSILKFSMFKKDVRNFCWLRQRSEFEKLVTLSLYTQFFFSCKSRNFHFWYHKCIKNENVWSGFAIKPNLEDKCEKGRYLTWNNKISTLKNI